MGANLQCIIQHTTELTMLYWTNYISHMPAKSIWFSRKFGSRRCYDNICSVHILFRCHIFSHYIHTSHLPSSLPNPDCQFQMFNYKAISFNVSNSDCYMLWCVIHAYSYTLCAYTICTHFVLTDTCAYTIQTLCLQTHVLTQYKLCTYTIQTLCLQTRVLTQHSCKY